MKLNLKQSQKQATEGTGVSLFLTISVVLFSGVDPKTFVRVNTEIWDSTANCKRRGDRTKVSKKNKDRAVRFVMVR